MDLRYQPAAATTDIGAFGPHVFLCGTPCSTAVVYLPEPSVYHTSPENHNVQAPFAYSFFFNENWYTSFTPSQGTLPPSPYSTAKAVHEGCLTTGYASPDLSAPENAYRPSITSFASFGHDDHAFQVPHAAAAFVGDGFPDSGPVAHFAHLQSQSAKSTP